MWGECGGRRIKQKGKRTHGQGQQCGDCSGAGGVRRLNGNGKTTIKKLKIKKVQQK